MIRARTIVGVVAWSVIFVGCSGDLESRRYANPYGPTTFYSANGDFVFRIDTDHGWMMLERGWLGVVQWRKPLPDEGVPKDVTVSDDGRRIVLNGFFGSGGCFITEEDIRNLNAVVVLDATGSRVEHRGSPGYRSS